MLTGAVVVEIEFVRLLEDLLMQVAKFRRRVDAQFIDERRPGAFERAECIGLTTRAIERQHVQRPKSLVVWMVGGERLELAHRIAMVTEPEFGIETTTRRAEPELGQPRDLGPHCVFASQIGVGGSLPQSDGVREDLTGGLRVSPKDGRCPFHLLLEDHRVDFEIA